MGTRDEIELMPDDDIDAILRHARGIERETLPPQPYEEPTPLPTDPRAQVAVLAERLQNALRDAHVMRQEIASHERENTRLRGQIQARGDYSVALNSKVNQTASGLERHEKMLHDLKGWQDKNKLHAAYIAGAIAGVGFVINVLIPIVAEHWK